MSDRGARRRGAIRPDAAQIEEQLLDLAAGLMARHGVQATSMSMMADAGGYSKAALFRRFGDKENLVTLCLQRCVNLGRQALQAVAASSAGPQRDRAALRTMLDLAVRWPGFIALALASITIRERDEFDGRLDPLGDALLAMFSISDVDDREKLLPSLGALSVIAVLTLHTGDDENPSASTPAILHIAEAALRG